MRLVETEATYREELINYKHIFLVVPNFGYNYCKGSMHYVN